MEMRAGVTAFFLTCSLILVNHSAWGVEDTTGHASAPTIKVPQPGTPMTPMPNLPKLPADDPAFTEVVDEIAPLTPSQIRELRKWRDEAERAQAAQPRFQPKPVYSDLPVRLRPKTGEAPQMVRTFPNFITNVLFYDDYGNPLLVKNLTVPNAKYFTITWSKDEAHPTNGIEISPLQMYSNGSVSVQLDGVPGRVSLLLVSGQREVDIDAIVRVQGVGSPQIVAGVNMPGNVDPVMLGLLAGVAPDDARHLTSTNGNVQAWKVADSFYVRTNLTLLSPAATSIQRGADGSAVYKIQPTPVLVALAGGEAVQIYLAGY